MLIANFFKEKKALANQHAHLLLDCLSIFSGIDMISKISLIV